MHGSTHQQSGRGTADSHIQKYRPDIDGLRAIAVLSVILYHVDSRLLPGGFLGVDMFFVISGYLITSIIRREQAAGCFTLRAFYERRVRRIMPALLFVLVITTAVSMTLLLPTDLVGYARSLLATLVFVANVYFFRDTNYFSPAAENKPLLHMWSLGIEEQFYLFFPLLLMLLFRYRRSAFPVVVALTLLSLAVNIVALYYRKTNPAFFLIPFRAWELGVGAMLAFQPQRSPGDRPMPLAAVAGALSLALALALAGAQWLERVFVPSAVLAVGGTALLIRAHTGVATPVGKVLGSRPFVLVGLISYSLYLWHWPMLVLPRYYLVRHLSPAEIAVAILASFAVATLSWRYVERPFRQKSLPPCRVYGMVCAAVLALCIPVVYAIQSDGLPGRLNPRAAAINQAVGSNYRCRATSFIRFGALYACPIALPGGRPTEADTVLFGNSHAQMYVPALESALEALGRKGLLVPANGCLPSVGVNISVDCDRIMRRNLDAIESLPRVETVILAYNWHIGHRDLVDSAGNRLEGDYSVVMHTGVRRAIQRLEDAGKRVVVVGPIAVPGFDIASTLSRKLAFGHEIDVPLWTGQFDMLAPHRTALDAFAADPSVTLLEPHRVQCRDERCYFIDGDVSLFADGNHFASAATAGFVSMFQAALADK